MITVMLEGYRRRGPRREDIHRGSRSFWIVEPREIDQLLPEILIDFKDSSILLETDSRSPKMPVTKSDHHPALDLIMTPPDLSIEFLTEDEPFPESLSSEENHRRTRALMKAIKDKYAGIDAPSFSQDSSLSDHDREKQLRDAQDSWASSKKWRRVCMVFLPVEDFRVRRSLEKPKLAAIAKKLLERPELSGPIDFDFLYLTHSQTNGVFIVTDGQHRLFLCKKMGFQRVPCRIAISETFVAPERKHFFSPEPMGVKELMKRV